MTIFTNKQRQLLLANGSEANRHKDTPPVAVLSIPAMQTHLLISKIIEGSPVLAFGLVEFFDGKPHVAYVSLDDLQALVMNGVEIENDTCFEGNFPMSVFIDAARERGGISISDCYLEEIAKRPTTKKKYNTVMVTLPNLVPLIRSHDWTELK